MAEKLHLIWVSTSSLGLVISQQMFPTHVGHGKHSLHRVNHVVNHFFYVTMATHVTVRDVRVI